MLRHRLVVQKEFARLRLALIPGVMGEVEAARVPICTPKRIRDSSQILQKGFGECNAL